MTRKTRPDDKVGYGKPPKASQFKRGQSGKAGQRDPRYDDPDIEIS